MEGQIEIDTIYKYTADASFTNSQGTWNIAGSTSISHTVLVNGNTILVPYTRTQASTYVTITYVDEEDTNNILYEEVGTTLLYIGQAHGYTVPGSFPDSSGGLWSPVAVEPGAYNHSVTASDNHIIIPCQKLMTEVTINYIDYENSDYIIYTDTISVQVGTNYTYEYAPEEYVDSETGEHWELIPSQNISIVIDADSQNNVINIQYLKIVSTAKVVVTGDWINTENGEVIVVITNLLTGKRYHGILKQGEEERTIFKYLPLGTYSISCMDQLTEEYVGSDTENNIFAITEFDEVIEIEVINRSTQPKGFYSLDSADNMMKFYIEGE